MTTTLFEKMIEIAKAYGIKLNKERVIELMNKYKWIDAEKCMSELQFAVNLLTLTMAYRDKPNQVGRSLSIYAMLVNAFRELRSLLEEEKLLKPEDHLKVDEELKKEGKSFDIDE